MDDYAISSLEAKIKSWFVGYKQKRVSNHLNKIEIVTHELKSYKNFIGIKYGKEYEVKVNEIDFTENFTFVIRNKYSGQIVMEYFVQCAIDEDSKTVYWKAQII